ncbi:Uncharacterized protein Adt_33659 [Abeliophyllum distichum]|uniref:Uncharacterized protein n=1 Tax=Abeliophyllum distichum TaxID=126358 RepID=A0ABD1QWV0_9LAMI
MERCGRQRWDIFRQEAPRKISQYRKANCGCWQPAVPLWEKEFCKVVGSLDWEMFLRKKKFVHLYDNVMNWDDSEGKEAFQNAKTRFWLEKHGVPCDVPLPDPDLHIDKIDWDSENDIELPFDLDINPVFRDPDENREPVVIFGDSFFVNQAFSPTGWGDYEENMKMPTNSTSANHVDPWEHNWGNAFPNAFPIGCCWNNVWGWNYLHNPQNYGVEAANVNDRRANGVQGIWDVNTAAQVNAGNYVWWYNEGQQKATYVGETSNADKMPTLGGWNSMNSYGPVTHQAAIAVGRMWN